MTVLGITASREFPAQSEIIIWDVMKEYLADLNLKEIVFGGAEGGDTIALSAALLYRTNPDVKLTVILPGTLKDQPQETWAVTTQADEIIELNGKGKDRYKDRNQAIVDRSTKMTAFWNMEFASGTGQTIRLAKKAGKSVEVWKLI